METPPRLLVPADTPGGQVQELRKLVDTDDDLTELLIKLQDHHWRLNKAELSVCVRPDGSDHVLAEGAFAKVYRGVLNGSLTVAIKSITNPTPPSRVAFLEEIVCLMNLRHANIVMFYGSLIENKSLLLVMEYCPRGSLYDVMAHDTDGQLSWNHRGRQIALSVVRALVYMHARDAVHQDLKSKNVLLTKDWTAKLADLGLCTWPRVQGEEHSSTGTLEYSAPEVLSGACEKVSKAADIYSLGVLMYEIAAGKPPDNRNLDFRCIESVPQEIQDLIRACVDADPDARPTINQVFDVLSERQPPPTRPLDDRGL